MLGMLTLPRSHQDVQQLFHAFRIGICQHGAAADLQVQFSAKIGLQAKRHGSNESEHLHGTCRLRGACVDVFMQVPERIAEAWAALRLASESKAPIRTCRRAS